MNRANTVRLLNRYPLLYADYNKPLTQTLMCFGFEHGDGWYDIIKGLSHGLEPLIRVWMKEHPNAPCAACSCAKDAHYGCKSSRPGKCLALREHVDPPKNAKIPELYYQCWCDQYDDGHPRAVQVKEKFGTLRFYMTGETEEMSRLIHRAEERSAVTCEKCGKPGEYRDLGWAFTLCDSCTAKHKEEREAPKASAD